MIFGDDGVRRMVWKAIWQMGWVDWVVFVTN